MAKYLGYIIYLFSKKCEESVISIEFLDSPEIKSNPKKKVLAYANAIYYAYEEVTINRLSYIYFTSYIIRFLLVFLTFLISFISYYLNFQGNIGFLLIIISYISIYILYGEYMKKLKIILNIYPRIKKIFNEYVTFLKVNHKSEDIEIFYEWLNGDRMEKSKSILNEINEHKIFTSIKIRELLLNYHNQFFNLKF